MDRIRFLPTVVHGILDYVVGIALLVAPYLFAFKDQSETSTWVAWAVGAGLILYSLLTKFELGVVKVLPMTAHLAIEFVAAAFLALSPFIFGLSDQPANVWYPHVIVGIAVLLVGMVSKTQPEELSR